MNKLLILIVVADFICGCSSEKGIISVAPVSQKLKENPFTMWYPQDWKFKSAFDEPGSGLVKRSYILYHPDNRYCNILVEVIEPSPSGKRGEIQKSQIIAEKIRALQAVFKKDR